MKDFEVKRVVLPNGESLAYREVGQGPTSLILLHGNLSSSVFWDVLLEAVPGDAYRVIAPDLRGFGDSSYVHPVANIKDFSEDLKVLADALGLKRFVLAGWSLGGLVAQQYAADHPGDVSRLILVASTLMAFAIPKRDATGQILPGQFYASREDMEMFNRDLMETFRKQDADKMRLGYDRTVFVDHKPEEARYQRYMQAALQQRNKVDADCAVLNFNISHQHNGLQQGSGEVDKIQGPVLVMQGSRDVVVPPVLGTGLAQAYGDRARLLMLDAGHAPLNDCPQQFLAAFFGFIDEEKE